MKTAFLNAALACALIAGTAPIFASPAAAKSTFMTDCSAKYKAGKADGSVAADAKWTDFMKTSCSAAPAQAASANAAAPMQAVAAVQPAPVKQMKSPAAPAAIVPVSASANGTFMQACSASWKSLKAAGTVPAAMAWKDFIAQQCKVDASASTAAAIPVKASPAKLAHAAAPIAASADTFVPADPSLAAAGMKTVDKNGKPFTPAQMAEHQRIADCGSEWRADKTAGTLPNGATWPQFWSSCNTRLKTQG